MALADGDNQGSSAVDCAAQNVRLQCVNTRDQIAPMHAHGDFFPSCTNTTTAETDYPPLEASDGSTAACDDDEPAFMAATDAMMREGGYARVANLTAMCGANPWGPYPTPGHPCLRGRFLYRVSNGAVHGKMVLNGAFGWLSIGLENPGGKHNGMNGARIVLGIPGTPESYTAATGLDVSAGPSMSEYVIHEHSSSFRFWSAPYHSPSMSDASIEVNDCITAMSFTTHAISGWSLNLTGTDTLIWGVNTEDAFVGYHGRDSRGKLAIDWTGAGDAGGGEDDDLSTAAIAGIVGGGAALVLGAIALAVSLACMAKMRKTPEVGVAAKTGQAVEETSTTDDSKI